jgi:hypothetical protein
MSHLNVFNEFIKHSSPTFKLRKEGTSFCEPFESNSCSACKARPVCVTAAKANVPLLSSEEISVILIKNPELFL